MPGVLHTRSLACAKNAHELVTTGMPNEPAFPARWFEPAASCSPRGTGLNSPRRLARHTRGL